MAMGGGGKKKRKRQKPAQAPGSVKVEGGLDAQGSTKVEWAGRPG
jgi:hypothetical protein